MATYANEGNINWDGNWQKVTKADALHASTNLNVDSGSTQYSGYWTGAASSTDHGCLAFLATLTTPATARTITCTLQSDDNTDFSSPTDEQTATYLTASGTKLLTWLHFKFGSTEAEDSSTPLYYRYKFTSDNAADTGFRAASADATKVAVVQILNETGTLAATDVTYIVGLGTQTSGNSDAATVTININDASNNYGACYIGNGGVMTYRTDASTTTEIRFAGNVTLYNGSACYIGSTGTPIPNSSKAYMKFACGSSRQYYLDKRTGATLQMQGTPNAYHKTKLDGAITAGTIKQFSVNDSTGWLVGDRLVICYAGSSSASDVVTITGISGTTIYIDTNGDGSGTGVSLSAHGDDGIVAKLTHPVQFESTSSSYYTVVNLNDSNYDADFDGVGFKYSGWGNTAEWAVFGCNFDDCSFESCSSTLIANYQSFAGASSMTDIVIYNSGRFMSGWYSISYNLMKNTFTVDDGVICASTLGGNTFYFNAHRGPMFYKNVDFSYIYTGGGDMTIFSSQESSIYFENCTFEYMNGLTSRTFISFTSPPASRTRLEFRNCVFGTHSAMTGNFVANISDQTVLFYNCILNGSPTMLSSVNAISTILTPQVAWQNYGQVSGRNISYAKYGTISDQVTGGQTAAWARGDSGICVYMSPSSATAGQTLDWEFYVPVTASTSFTLSFYTKLTSTTNPSTLTCTIYDSDDDITKLLDAESVSMTDSWGEYTSSACVPTNTGFCRVVLKALKGSATTSIGIDDVHTT